MIRVCSNCKAKLGETGDRSDPSHTDGYCYTCFELVRAFNAYRREIDSLKSEMNSIRLAIEHRKDRFIFTSAPLNLVNP